MATAILSWFGDYKPTSGASRKFISFSTDSAKVSKGSLIEWERHAALTLSGIILLVMCLIMIGAMFVGFNYSRAVGFFAFRKQCLQIHLRRTASAIARIAGDAPNAVDPAT